MRYLKYLKHDERQRLNDAMPLTEKAANEVYADAIREFSYALHEAETVESVPSWWIEGPDGSDCETYCEPCVDKEVERLNAEHVAKRVAEGNPPGPDVDYDDLNPWTAMGGGGPEEGMSFCEKCGCMLDYSLGDDTSIDQELEYWLEQHGGKPVTSVHEAVILMRAIDGMRFMGPIENDVIERCVDLIGLVDMDAVATEIAARRAGTWTPPDAEAMEMAA